MQYQYLDSNSIDRINPEMIWIIKKIPRIGNNNNFYCTIVYTHIISL